MPALEVSFGGLSTAGAKTINEDAFAAFQPSVHLCRTKGAVAVVADAVSSRSDGQQASQTAVTQFVDDFLATPETWTVKASAARVIQGLNSWFYRHSRDDASMLTTFTAVVLRAATAHIFHVGDCRVARWRSRVLEPLTNEHRAGRDSYLTRALGMETRLDVDYITDEVLPGDLYLLTSDGVHDFVRDSDIEDVLEGSTDLEDSATRIVDIAMEAGSDDSITCLMLEVVHVGEETLDEAERRIKSQVVPPPLPIDTTLDGFRVIRVLHKGKRNNVYLVDSPNDEKPLVIKVPAENADADYVERFLREEWIGQRIDHPACVRYLERPRDTSFLYILMEHVPGQTLRQWMRDNPRPTLHEVRRIVTEIAGGLGALRQKHMLHQDLNPENIVIDDDGRLRIIDLGRVHVTGLEELQPSDRALLVGPRGAHDAHASQSAADPHADIFALGCICYELLSGVMPERQRPAGSNEAEERFAYRPLKECRADIPDWVDATLAKALAWERYDSLTEFLRDLTEPNPKLVKRLRAAPLMKRNPLSFWRGLAGLLALLLVLSLIF